MKSLKLLFGYVILSSGGYAQHYTPFPKWDTHPVWRVDKVHFESTEFSIYDYLQYELTGDTVIGAYTYQKLTATGTTNGNYPHWTYYSVYAGAIREDSIAKKIYYHEGPVYGDTLLYDFSLGIGDTVGPAYNTHYPYDIVDAVDSVMIDGTYRRRMKVSDSYIIEGIGSTSGLLEPVYFFENYTKLLCYTQDWEIVYPDTATGCPLVTEGIEDIKTAQTIFLAPNPVTDISTVSLKNACNNCSYELFIVNAQGQLIKEYEEHNTSEMLINANDFKEGVYYCCVSYKNAFWGSCKFLVVK